MVERGRLIVNEGEDRMGKTTQTEMQVARWNKEVGPAKYWHEPGGEKATELGKVIEAIVKSTEIPKTVMAQVALFTYATVDAWKNEIEPGLEKGISYFLDRNWISTAIYQGMAGGFGAERVKQITEKNLPPEYVFPDYTFIINPTDAHRQKMRDLLGVNEQDFFESKPQAFQDALRRGYQELPEGFVQFERHVGSKVLRSAEIFTFEGEIDDIHERMWSSLEQNVLNVR